MNDTQTTGKKSKYQDKMRRKRGRGKVSPNWMWWLDAAVPVRTVGK